MPSAVCNNCGSRSFRADRSLGGRLICQRCGRPAGTVSIRRGSSRSQHSKGRFWITVLLITVLAVVLLSAL